MIDLDRLLEEHFPSDLAADVAPPGPLRAVGHVSDGAFADAYGTAIEDVLDVRHWSPAEDLLAAGERLEREIAESERREDGVRRTLRKVILARLADAPNAPPGAGHYRVSPHHLAQAQRKLTHGGAAAVGGAACAHDALALGIVQLGACVVAYDEGDEGRGYGVRLFRHEFRDRRDPVAEASAALLLERRALRDADAVRFGAPGRDPTSELARRGLRAFGERANLLDHATARWRFGSGPFAPFELLTGNHNPALLRAGLDLLERWVDSHPTFAFVGEVRGGSKERLLASIGGALRPGEFAVVRDDRARCASVIDSGNLRGRDRLRAEDWVDRVARQVVCGVARVTAHAPAVAFWAHADLARQAAIAVMADAALRPYSNRPVLLDVARATADAAFPADAFEATVRGGYGRAGRAAELALA